MKIYTLEHLSDYLSEELIWRKKELTSLKSLIQLSSLSASKQDFLIRGGVAILYAHWEGFIKNASSAYIEFVARQRLNYIDLSPNFIALAMKDKLELAKTTNKATVFVETCDFLLNELNQQSSLSFKNSINTKSNLSSEVLRDITVTLGLDFSFFITKEKIIDEKLLKNRNSIAHGQYLNLRKDDYLDLHIQIIEMMDVYRGDIDNSASLQKYLNKV